MRDLLDAIEPQQDGDLLRPIARWVYNAVRVNLDLLHGICGEFGCQQGEDVATWLRARLAGVPTPCMCSGVGPCEQRTDGSCRRDRAAVPAQAPFQQRVQPWMLACFGAKISADKLERNHRFFEEAGELVQACGMTREEAHALVDYTWSRPVGETTQEVGGVMVTLAALCLANELDMHAAGETELARVWTMVEQIRAKQAAKPKHSPLPGAARAPVVSTQFSFAFSADADRWSGPFDSVVDAISDALRDTDPDRVVYVGENEPVSIDSESLADEVIERIEEQAYEQVGDVADTVGPFDSAQKQPLVDWIRQWVDQHADITCWSVQKIKGYGPGAPEYDEARARLATERSNHV
ncbi:hypothetical protein [Burkholderia ubonensis]|uniref:hypothetical protein n=1 Tax=Burkholderia ubonensis TaxID=101571 RepID=UPI0007C87AE3|nr:hypothetical protein [Burkholderia ubonensis]